ncbi:MAG TPA: hypothetical protein VL860_12320, partial [Planctomycetota bacterium]|nr:hypothetical protein [Planctomycetota bacterium]
FNGTDFDWALFDDRVGPMLDGSMFKGCRRDAEPIPLMYLPFSESWPADLIPHFKASFWADEAFDDNYVNEMKKSYAAFAKHADQKGWHKTLFEFFLNNKVYYREQANTTKSVVAPWIFDEPTCTQDFWALRWYGILFHQAVDPVRGKAKMIFRADVSYSHFGRDINWGVMDWECFGGGTEQKARQKRDQMRLWGPTYFSEYGSANKIEDANVQPVAWCLTSWSRGSSGVLPWLTYGDAKSWTKADQTCLFYEQNGGSTAAPSIRLKAFLQGEQIVEYMTLLSDCNGVTRAAVAEGMKQAIDLNSKVIKTSETDAGTIQFAGASPAALWNLKVRAGKMLDAKHPAFKKALVDWSIPATDMKKLPNIGYVPVAPDVPSYKPAADTFTRR